MVLKLLKWRPSKKNCERAATQCVTGEAICASVASQKLLWLTSPYFSNFSGIKMWYTDIVQKFMFNEQSAAEAFS